MVLLVAPIAADVAFRGETAGDVTVNEVDDAVDGEEAVEGCSPIATAWSRSRRATNISAKRAADDRPSCTPVKQRMKKKTRGMMTKNDHHFVTVAETRYTRHHSQVRALMIGACCYDVLAKLHAVVQLGC